MGIPTEEMRKSMCKIEIASSPKKYADRPKMLEKQYKDSINHMLDFLCEREIRWNFVSSLRMAFSRYGKLTDKQYKALKNIYDKCGNVDKSLPHGMRGTYSGMYNDGEL